MSIAQMYRQAVFMAIAFCSFLQFQNRGNRKRQKNRHKPWFGHKPSAQAKQPSEPFTLAVPILSYGRSKSIVLHSYGT